MSDPTRAVEPFLKSFLKSLDTPFNPNGFSSVEHFASHFGKQIQPSCAIIVNGKPVVPTSSDSRVEFQKKWLASPASQHTLTAFDCHIIPGTPTVVVTAQAKVKFDESGVTRLGESGDLLRPDNVTFTGNRNSTMGSFFGVCLTLVCDQSIMNSEEAEAISQLDYRITYKPPNSAISL
ncbi:mRNA transport regulator Mtr2p [Diutina catenulata]